MNNYIGFRWFLKSLMIIPKCVGFYLLKEKSDIERTIRNLPDLSKFNAMIKTQFQTTIQTFRTDNGREYFHSNSWGLSYNLQVWLLSTIALVQIPLNKMALLRKESSSLGDGQGFDV